MKRLNVLDNVYGRLTVVTDVSRLDRHRMVRCRCECGRITTVLVDSLRSGRTRSCGCWHRERAAAVAHVSSYRHGGHGTPEYAVWRSMKSRCLRSNDSHYRYYGGRGITVCDRWRYSFAAFWADLGSRPTPTHVLDRIDNDGHYQPSNCRWATPIESNTNRRTVKLITFQGQTRSVAAWERQFSMTRGRLRQRLSRHWSIDRALFMPSLKHTFS